MKGIYSLLGLSLAASQASAHYIFWQLSIGSTQYAEYQYIRENTNYNSPVTDLTSDDLRCNVGANGSTTATITVQAGAQFTFTLDTAVYHQGPISIYMSKAPGAASDYDGSGPWFKIYDWGPIFSNGQATWNLADTYTYNIPTCIPNGDYLLRIQSLAIHNPWPAGIPQFYTECAQITVTGGGNAVPSPTAYIPGAFSDTDPGYTVNIYNDFTNYTVPGPAVWSCNGASSGPAPSSSTTGSSPPPTSSVKPSTTSTKPTTLSTSTKPATTTTSGSGGCVAAQYAQCGGQGWTGCTTCASGTTCKYSNQYYSQCL